MFNQKEITWIIVISIILGFTLSLMVSLQVFFYALSSVFLVISINVLAKKVASYYLDSEIEIKLWEIKRFGFRPHWHFKKPVPAGAFMPILVTTLFLGTFTWMACLVFDIKSKVYKAAKRHGLYKFSEVSEYHLGLIAAAGVIANLFFAVVGYLIGFSDFARINIYYAFFNMIPISDLDGNKIFFGSLILWSFLGSIALIALGYAFLLV